MVPDDPGTGDYQVIVPPCWENLPKPNQKPTTQTPNTPYISTTPTVPTTY